MDENKLHIKNMVCPRCIMAVREQLEKHGIEASTVKLGTVMLRNPITDRQKNELGASLESIGFELLDGKQERIVEQVKNIIVNLVHNRNGKLSVNLSDHIADQMHLDYNYISSLFSEHEGSTIEKYFIAQKVERIKELLEYGEMTVAEIAAMLNYSSSAHLSAQFKKATGLTPSQYKASGAKDRKPLDDI